ncbi:hypothetical protein QMU85_000879 [Photobacterium damselae]|nr:hypothetical protein [Photobacterium damselae]
MIFSGIRHSFPRLIKFSADYSIKKLSKSSAKQDSQRKLDLIALYHNLALSIRMLS